jgi:hypothetical protein
VARRHRFVHGAAGFSFAASASAGGRSWIQVRRAGLRRRMAAPQNFSDAGRPPDRHADHRCSWELQDRDHCGPVSRQFVRRYGGPKGERRPADGSHLAAISLRHSPPSLSAPAARAAHLRSVVAGRPGGQDRHLNRYYPHTQRERRLCREHEPHRLFMAVNPTASLCPITYHREGR